MKKMLMVGLVGLGILIAVGISQAGGDIENGKMLFESPTFGGGTSGKTCASCHPGGKGLSSKAFRGTNADKLAATVNACIKKPLAGKGIDPAGTEMADVVAYMKSLVKGVKKAVEGC